MKRIEVAIAVVVRDGRVLICRRRDDDPVLGGYWEFPGGKLEPGETIEQCLVRELEEEVSIAVRPERTDHTREVTGSSPVSPTSFELPRTKGSSFAAVRRTCMLTVLFWVLLMAVLVAYVVGILCILVSLIPVFVGTPLVLSHLFSS